MTSSSPFSNAPIRILGEQGGACESEGDIGDEGNGCNSNNGAMGNVGPATRATALQQEQPCTSHQAPKRPKVEFGKGLKDHEERQKARSSSSPSPLANHAAPANLGAAKLTAAKFEQHQAWQLRQATRSGHRCAGVGSIGKRPPSLSAFGSTKLIAD